LDGKNVTGFHLPEVGEVCRPLARFKSLKIAFVGYDRPGYHAGPIVNARRLLPELKQLGHEPVGLFMYQDGGAPTVDALRSLGIECRLRPFKGNTEERIRWILSQLEDIQPDVFVPNLSVSAWFAARWAREAGIPTIAAMRNDDPFYWDMVHQFVVGDPTWAVSGMVAVSKDLRDRVSALKPSNTKLCAIPSGVPVPAEPTAKLEPLQMCYLGRMEQVPKQVLFLAEVMCEVMRKVPTATGRFVGQGSALEEVKELTRRRNLASRFDFPGAVPSEQVSDHLAGNCVILLASDHEGLPGALMDAMSHGVVPVCSEIPGGLLELVRPEETGVIVERTVAGFASAIVELAQDGTRWERLSAAARKEIVSSYSLPSAAARWIRFCEELIADAGPRRPLIQPKRIRLPRVMPGLAAEDRRQVTRWQQLETFARQKAKGLKRRMLNVLRATPPEAST